MQKWHISDWRFSLSLPVEEYRQQQSRRSAKGVRPLGVCMYYVAGNLMNTELY